MIKSLLLISFLLFFTAILFAGNDPVTVFAAAGTAVPVRELSKKFQQMKQVEIETNFASSGTLARQIKNGAEADIFISANEQWIKYLDTNGFLEKGTIKKICSNSLALITPKGSDIALKFSSNINPKKLKPYIIAIGDPGYVPVGKYSRQVFNSMKCFEKLQNDLILTKDVSSVLRYVETGEADLGIVYYTEALLSDKVDIIQIIPADMHKPINFYIALVKNASEDSQKFYHFLISKDAKKVFKQNGYIVNER